jgi:hypothetical protein
MARKYSDLVLVRRRTQLAIFVMHLALLALNLIVAMGNWHFYARVEKVETTLGLQATPQSPQIPLQTPQPKS